MRQFTILALTCMLITVVAFSQVSQVPAAQTVVPQYIRFSSVVPNTDSERVSKSLHFAIYAEKDGGTPLWAEDQTVSVAVGGGFTVLLGVAGEGVPSSIFVSGEARWIAVSVDGAEVGPRALMVSVPYAMKAADSDTVGGVPASAFVTRAELVTAAASAGGVTTLSGANTMRAATDQMKPQTSGNAIAGASTHYYIPLWTDSFGTLGNSNLYQNPSGALGIGTTSPNALLDISSNTTDGTNAFRSEVTLTNTTPITGVTSAMNMQYIDASQANVLSKQTMRLTYVRDVSATGLTTAFDTMLTTGATVNSVANQLRAINVEGPTVATGVSLSRYYGIYVGAPTGTIGTASALVTQPGAGNVGIGTVNPSALLEVAGNVKISGGGTLMFNDGTTQSTAAVSGVNTLTAGDTSITVGGTASARTVAVNTAVIQKRVTSVCPAGAAMVQVNADGTTVCGTIGGAGSIISVPVIVAQTTLTGGPGTGTPQTIYSVTADGMYRVSIYMNSPTNGTCPSGPCSQESITLSWNDGVTTSASTAVTCSLLAPCGTSATIPLWVKSGTAIQALAQAYGAGVNPSGGTYSAYLVVEKLQQ